MTRSSCPERNLCTMQVTLWSLTITHAARPERLLPDGCDLGLVVCAASARSTAYAQYRLMAPMWDTTALAALAATSPDCCVGYPKLCTLGGGTGYPGNYCFSCSIEKFVTEVDRRIIDTSES